MRGISRSSMMRRFFRDGQAGFCAPVKRAVKAAENGAVRGRGLSYTRFSMRPWLPTLLLLAGSAHATDLPQIRERGSLRVLVSADEHPDWFSFEGGSNPGFEREILEGFARLQRVRLEATPVQAV